MFGVGLPELIIIGGIVFLVFGPSVLPKFAKGAGQAIREFRGVKKELESKQEAEHDNP